jgi:uncharacterized iron-regulated protein
MKKRAIKRQFSFSTMKHIEKRTTENTVTTDIYLTKDEALRFVAAVVNTLIHDPDTKTIHIVGYDMPENRTHCTVRPYKKGD